MASSFDSVDRKRDIIDRKLLAGQIDDAFGKNQTGNRAVVVQLLLTALNDGRAEISRRLCENPSQGYRAAAEQAFLIDQIVRLIYDHVTQHLYPLANPLASERIALLAVGGYGRGEMAPHSEIGRAHV